MRLFGFEFGKKQTGGMIRYFGLADWWQSAFTDEERRHIRETYQPLGASGDTLTTGNISYSSQSAAGFLHTLASWFHRPNDRPLAHKILAKAEEFADDAPVLDRHFKCQTKLELYYKDRNQPGFLDKAMDACREQIALAPEAAEAFRATYEDSPLPSHSGYGQLAVILEKQMRYEEAISLCAGAEQEGWAGDWGKRIERCRKKLAKRLGGK
jgi:hypothetical protein